MTRFTDEILSSTSAGLVSTFFGHPLDTIKIHLQTQKHTSRSSYFQSIHLARKLGASHLFRGIGPPMTNQIIMNSVMFSVFRSVKESIDGSNFLDQNSSAALAGLISGFATACISTPVDWIKIQAQLNTKASNSFDIFRDLINKNGSHSIPIVFRGHSANLAREGVFTMVYLGLYDRISSSVKSSKKEDDLSTSEIICISSFTGAFAWLCNYPFDTVKTIMQGKGLSLGASLRYIWGEGGFKSLFRGVSASTGRAVLVTSSRMVVYEKTMTLLQDV
ncbi:hypothetical protein CTEN210_07908 [Chaetoceros tenuissimus]|uniref:Mitochondrial carrier protein n=1 Tax=Chaetoceros tenuissimus TaxID=426638 RepID=A0AAD3CSK4_9STRA|nr:hypothetical protein CTEN210_07908 [Chaetoceros tenuissimus]